jgi:hypothetical protein
LNVQRQTSICAIAWSFCLIFLMPQNSWRTKI